MYNWDWLPPSVCDKIRQRDFSEWMLVHAQGHPFKMCDSGLCAVITTDRKGRIRVDLMNVLEPIFSFSSKNPEQIYRAMEYWLKEEKITLSVSHLMYIGREVQRAWIDGMSYEQE